MGLDLLITSKSQAQSLCSLHLLISQKGIRNQVVAFLLACKVEGKSKHTIRDYKLHLGYLADFCDQLGLVEVSQVTKNHLRLMMLRFEEMKPLPTCAHFFRAFHRFFAWLEDEDVLTDSPARKLHPPKLPETIIVPFKMDQVKSMIAVNPPNEFLPARDRAIILTFLDSGVRLSEMAAMQLADVDMERGVIKVMGKGARERVVGIGQKTRLAILHYVAMRKDKLPCLWVNRRGKPLTAWGIKNMITDTGRRAEVSGVRCSPHTFRHTFGTTALRNGASERQVQLLLGHKTRTMTQHYTATITSEDAVIKHRDFSPVDHLLEK